MTPPDYKVGVSVSLCPLQPTNQKATLQEAEASILSSKALPLPHYAGRRQEGACPVFLALVGT